MFLVVLNHQRLLSVLVLTRTQSGCQHNATGNDFIRVVLIRTFPGALYTIAMTSGCFVVSTAMVLLLNWINSKIISGAAFGINGLTEIPKIDFLPLDWIYRSI